MSSRQITIIANWKANLPPSEEVALAKEIAQGVGGALQAPGLPSSLRLLLAPSTLGLVAVASLLRREFPEAGVEVAAQDISRSGAGAFTGEIPARGLQLQRRATVGEVHGRCQWQSFPDHDLRGRR